MKWIAKSILTILLLLFASQGYGQQFQVEGAAAWQKLVAPSGNTNDNVVYPFFGIGYQVTGHHSVWLTFASISEQSFLQLPPGTPTYGNRLHIRAYPIGLQYRYRVFKDTPVNLYFKASLLVIPITDTVEQDTRPEPGHSTNLGGDLGIGLQIKLNNRLGLFGSANYRLVKNSDGRFLQHMDIKGFWVQVGTMIRL
jgi:hypothetical protein